MEYWIFRFTSSKNRFLSCWNKWSTFTRSYLLKEMKNNCFACPYLYPENPTFGTWESIKRQAKQTLRFGPPIVLEVSIFFVSSFWYVFFQGFPSTKTPWPWKNGKISTFIFQVRWVFCCISWMGMQHGNGGELQKTINWLPSFEVGFTKNSPNQSLGSLS